LSVLDADNLEIIDFEGFIRWWTTWLYNSLTHSLTHGLIDSRVRVRKRRY
jgi:hypothetical protein